MVVAVLLTCAMLAQYISPAKFWLFSMLGFTFFTFYVLNLILLIYWIIKCRRYLILPLIMFLAGLKPVTAIVQFNMPESKEAQIADGKPVKIMSYNVRLFDLYNWSNNLNTRAKIFDLIADEAPEILCIQEFYNSDKGEFQNLDTIIKVQKAKNYHVEYTHTLRKVDHWGIATLSYYPIVNKGKLDLDSDETNHIVIFTDIKIDEDTIRVYNVHLQSIKLQKKDYELIEKFEAKNDNERIEGSKIIFNRLKDGFIKRASQVEILEDHIKSSPYPIIVCGDFNDTPISYVYGKLSDNLKDAFVQSGFGFGRTYAGIFPSFRIDYILHDKRIKSGNYNTINKPYSDHYPIYCTLFFNE